MTEAEVIATIDKIARRLASRFQFGFHTRKDIEQEARVLAIQGLEKYKDGMPLENFLQVHVYNRLINFKRDNFERPNMPCLTCPLYDPEQLVSSSQCKKFDDKLECEMWKGWVSRNASKRNLMNMIDLSECINDEHEKYMRISSSTEHELEESELSNIINKHISIELRPDYIQMKAGVKLPKARQVKVQEEVRKILDTYYYDNG